MQSHKRGGIICALILSAAQLAPGAAFAQDGTETAASRTPESAQRFLASLDEIGGGIDGMISGSVKFSSTSACKTDVLLSKVQRMKSFSWIPDSRDLTTSVDWSKPDRATIITQSYDRTNIRLLMPVEEGVGYLNLGAGSPQTLNRIMNAMQYLQEACDTAKDTGF